MCKDRDMKFDTFHNQQRPEASFGLKGHSRQYGYPTLVALTQRCFENFTCASPLLHPTLG